MNLGASYVGRKHLKGQPRSRAKSRRSFFLYVDQTGFCHGRLSRNVLLPLNQNCFR